MYKIWNRTDLVNGKTPQEVMNVWPFTKDTNATVILECVGKSTVVGIHNLDIKCANAGIEFIDTDTDEMRVQKLTAKEAQDRLDEQARIVAEQALKQEELEDRYARDCNDELATINALPNVSPISEPVVEDPAYLNFKWNYDRGYWRKTNMRLLVQKGQISIEEYKAITGEDYSQDIL